MANQGRNYGIAFAIGAKLASNFNSIFTSATNTVNNLANAALAFAGISFGVDGIKEAFSSYQEFEQSMANLQVQGGLTSKELLEVSESAKTLFANNYGESMSDISESMANITQQTKLSGKELEEFTKNSLIMKDTFDFATEESTRAVNQMMKSLGVSSQEAFNLLAQGAQNGLNANGDLMDWVNEYSVHFSQMGFSAEEMFNMIGNGADSGVFQVEKLGDAIKEFGIRSKDGSNGTLEAFNTLGLNATQITKDFAAGGETAKKAFELVSNELFNMSDLVAQDQVGVALFGTMWEDLGKDGIKALSNINGEFDVTRQTMSEINNIKYDTLAGTWGKLMRSIEAIKIEVGEMMAPGLKKFLIVVSDYLPMAFNTVHKTINYLKAGIVETFNQLKDRVMQNKPLIDAVTLVIADMSQKFNMLKQSFLDAFKSPEGILFHLTNNILPAVADGLMFIVEKSADLYNFISSNWNSIGPILLGIVSAIGAYKMALLGAKTATTVYTTITKGMTVAQGALNAVMNMSPLARWSIIIGAAVAAGAYLYKNWDMIKAKALELWGSIQGVFGSIGIWFQDKWNGVLQVTQTIWGSIANFLGTFPVGQAFLQNITNMIESAKLIFNGVIDFIQNVFTGNWQGAWQAVQDIFSGIFNMLAGIVKAPLNSVIGIVNTVIKSINSIGFTIPEWVPIMGGKEFAINVPEIPMFAKGTTGFNTPDTFIAGEKGAELVTNAKGYKVFTANQTQNMLNQSAWSQRLYPESFSKSLVPETPMFSKKTKGSNILDMFIKPKQFGQNIYSGQATATEQVQIHINVNVDNYDVQTDLEEKAYQAALRGAEAAFKKFQERKERRKNLSYA